MRSRVLIGVGAWLLGAATATGGSLYAVAQLGQGLIAQHTRQVSIKMVNAELAQITSPPSISPTPSRSAAASPKASHTPQTPRSGATHQAPPVTRDARKLLTSEGGWAYASCSQGEASLLSVSPSPDQGFGVVREDAGPSTVASVTFANSSSGVTMKVTCDSSGVPVKHLSGWSNWSPHHDE